MTSSRQTFCRGKSDSDSGLVAHPHARGPLESFLNSTFISLRVDLESTFERTCIAPSDWAPGGRQFSCRLADQISSGEQLFSHPEMEAA
jgi:hypothetical protein